jgi:hypothetical protein
MNSNPNKQKYDLARNSKKFDDPNLINGYDYIMCKICGLKRQDIGNQQRDCDRDQMLMEDGFCVLHIKERDYKANKQGTLDACLKFLTE